MSLKEYLCENVTCESLRLTVSTDPQDVPLCPKCNRHMVWAPTAMTFALKGSGWTPKGSG